MKNPFAKPWCLGIQGKWSGQPPAKLTFWRFRTQAEAEAQAYLMNQRDSRTELAEYVAVRWRD